MKLISYCTLSRQLLNAEICIGVPEKKAHGKVPDLNRPSMAGPLFSADLAIDPLGTSPTRAPTRQTQDVFEINPAFPTAHQQVAPSDRALLRVSAVDSN
ncbi:hypothetical protein [Rhodoferax ferrireducens]|uniref:hypothetical protein n=1 Tax=Rhodoferax ferrireducens TaxID=192843 RepID=UPI00140F7E65|nr:hypothetical protein [Rhodoferax ferrireducens]